MRTATAYNPALPSGLELYKFPRLKKPNHDQMNTDSAEATETNPMDTASGNAVEAREDASAEGNDKPIAELSPQEIGELQTQAAKAKEHWDQLVRTAADFENYKKRAAREKQDAIKYANESLLQKLVTVLDNFDMAVAAAANSTDSTAKSLQTGVNMILSQFRNVLTESGLEEIDALNKTFDPNFHEAISQEDRADVPEGQVVQQVRKGYKLRDRLLRPASVVVSRKPSA
jgi:molecular chaperone GrpE